MVGDRCRIDPGFFVFGPFKDKSTTIDLVLLCLRSDIYGVPQRRSRLYFVLVRMDGCVNTRVGERHMDWSERGRRIGFGVID